MQKRILQLSACLILVLALNPSQAFGNVELYRQLTTDCKKEPNNTPHYCCHQHLKELEGYTARDEALKQCMGI